jgi:hypothetical protein
VTHVFISYVRENSEIVDRLCSELRSRGIEVWLDRESIFAGLRWKDAINKAINEGSFFIACFSNESNKRQQAYMYGEISVAVDRLRQMPRDRAWFIPVVLDGTKIPYIPINDYDKLSDIQTVSLSEDWNGGIRKILQSMKLDDPLHRQVLHLIDLITYHPTDRRHAVERLAEIGPAAAEAVPALIEALRDSADDVRQGAASALGKIGPAAAAAVPALIEALRDSNNDVRLEAVRALGEIGPCAPEAVAALRGARRDSDEAVCRAAADALGKLRVAKP